jgi:cation diffusion facilitator CzcD-associated flavoprotein CzcO
MMKSEASVQNTKVLSETDATKVHEPVDCLIIGAGISGIAMAYHAKNKGIGYKVIDKEPTYGGVWYQNNFPKLSTDSVEPLYNYKSDIPPFGSLSTNAKSPAQVREYLEQFVEKFDLDNGFQYSTKVLNSTFNGHGYTTNTTSGIYPSKYLVLAVGINGLDGKNTQKIPNFPDKDLFTGEMLHSSDLKADYDVSGKKVCVIGNGPTSIQLVESFAPNADYLTQICRTPRQMMKKLSFDQICGFLEKFNIDKNDNTAIFNFLDQFFHKHVFTGFSEENRQLKVAYGDMLSKNEGDMYHQFFPLNDKEKEFVSYMEEKNLIHGWSSGYSNLRQLFIETYDQDVLKDNVELVRSKGVKCMVSDGLITQEDKKIDADVVVCATGSTKIVDYPHFDLYDKDGNNLPGNAEKIAENFWGIANNNYPNMFYLLGPGCAGVQNVPPLVEVQANLISTIIDEAQAADKGNVQYIGVKEDVFNQYHEKASNDRANLQKVQAEVDKLDTMNNHQYHNGVNLHEFVGGTLEYRDQLEAFTSAENTLEAMGMYVEYDNIAS